MKISSSVFEASKKNFFRILIAIFILTSLFIIVFTISNLFNKKSNLIIDSYSTKLISESELEEIVKIKFSEDCIDNPEINVYNLGNNGISMGDWFLTPSSFINITYEVSEETLCNKEYYFVDYNTIKDKNYFDDEIYKALITNKIDENQVKYINVRYGTCVYDITNGINQVDYYFYVIVIKTDKQNYKILITGKYPYPIALN